MKIAIALALLFTLISPSLASERPDHFKGEASETLEQAFNNLREYNAKLAELVNKEELSAEELHQVHQLTYTLENALERLRIEQAKAAELLEEVHLASERAEDATVKASGRDYLKSVEQLVP